MTGYVGRRGNPWVLGGIIGAHVAALTLVAMAKMDVIPAPTFKRIIVKHVPLDKPKPPEVPPPPRRDETREPEMPSQITVIVPRVPMPTPGPVITLPPDYVPPNAGPIGDEIVLPPSPPTPQPFPLPEPPPPLPNITPVKLQPRGNPAGWVTNDDYPSAALRAEEQGRTAFRLVVASDGRPTDCAVTGSSGSSILDGAACRLLMKRARFKPGTDGSGEAVGGTWTSSFRWQIPED